MDTTIESARNKKLQKNAALAQALIGRGWRVNTEVCIYAVTGIIHKETHAALLRQGVTRNTATKCWVVRLRY